MRNEDILAHAKAGPFQQRLEHLVTKLRARIARMRAELKLLHDEGGKNLNAVMAKLLATEKQLARTQEENAFLVEAANRLNDAASIARTWHAACDQRSPEWYADDEKIRSWGT